MVDCKTCEYENVCTMPDFVRNDLKRCKVYQEKKPYTNADRIRSMSDEELAELFAQYSCEDSDYTSLLPIEECKWGTKQEVIKRNLQWLKSEAKE